MVWCVALSLFDMCWRFQRVFAASVVTLTGFLPCNDWNVCSAALLHSSACHQHVKYAVQNHHSDNKYRPFSKCFLYMASTRGHRALLLAIQMRSRFYQSRKRLWNHSIKFLPKSLEFIVLSENTTSHTSSTYEIALTRPIDFWRAVNGCTYNCWLILKAHSALGFSRILLLCRIKIHDFGRFTDLSCVPPQHLQLP